MARSTGNHGRAWPSSSNRYIMEIFTKVSFFTSSPLPAYPILWKNSGRMPGKSFSKYLKEFILAEAERRVPHGQIKGGSHVKVPSLPFCWPVPPPSYSTFLKQQP